MRNTHNKNTLFIVVAFISTFSMAQTVNKGELLVLPNTELSIFNDFYNLDTGSLYNDGKLYIYANFINDGIVDYLDTVDATVFFQGSDFQIISGLNRSFFYNVVFNNNISESYAFELSSDISIANTANLYEGIINNKDFGGEMFFERYATHINTSSLSYVNGLVYKSGDVDFEFPIGDAQSNRWARITAPDNVDDLFSAQYVYQNLNNNYPVQSKAGVIDVVNDVEYWEVLRQNGSSDVLLTLSWDEELTPTNIIKEPYSAIRIVRWDSDENMWVDEGGVVDVDNHSVTTAAVIESDGVFTLARIQEDLVLPGDVVVYNGISPNGDGVNDYFKIDNIIDLPNNNVQIYNRWGVKVFETNNYDSHGNVFDGKSDGRITVNKDRKLPSGTYFYVLSYDYPNKGEVTRIKKAGYLYITTEY